MAARDVGELPDAEGTVITEETVKLCGERFKSVQDAAKTANDCAKSALVQAEEAENAMVVVQQLASTAGTCADTKKRIEDNGNSS